MIRVVKNHSLFTLFIGPRWLWINVVDKRTHKPLFSERNGYDKRHWFGRYGIMIKRYGK
jgi:hypothetical protein